MEAVVVAAANVLLEESWIPPSPSFTPLPPAYSSVTLVGPGCSTPVDTEYYQKKVRGRGAGRRPHDLVLAERWVYNQFGPNEHESIGMGSRSSPVASLA